MRCVDPENLEMALNLRQPQSTVRGSSALSKLVLVALLWFIGTGVASACSLFEWSSAVGLTSADVGEPNAGFRRYSGFCALRVNGPSKFVQDDSPAAESTYSARFYVYTGNMANADVFAAYRQGGTEMFRVQYNAGAFSFVVKGAAVQPAPIPALANRWYSVEVAWRQGVTPGFTVIVQGNGSQSSATSQASILPAADSVDFVRLGMINAGASGTGFFDDFDSRRSGPIGRLCRGDSTSDFVLNGADAQAVIAEASLSGLAFGRPDCTENGVVNSQDAQCIADLVVAGIGCGSGIAGEGFMGIFASSFE